MPSLPIETAKVGPLNRSLGTWSIRPPIIHTGSFICSTREDPVQYPDYANLGNNDRWIAIQNYQNEEWDLLIQLWASTNRHIVHVIEHIDEKKLDQVWTSALDEEITLEAMIKDYPRHFNLHVREIEELMQIK